MSYTPRPAFIFFLFVFIIGFAAAALANNEVKVSPEELEKINIYTAWTGLTREAYALIEDARDISEDPELAAIQQLYRLGEIYQMKNQPEKLIETLEEVLEKSNNPTLRNAAYHLLGDKLRDMGELDRALEVLQRGLAENLKITQ